MKAFDMKRLILSVALASVCLVALLLVVSTVDARSDPSGRRRTSKSLLGSTSPTLRRLRSGSRSINYGNHAMGRTSRGARGARGLALRKLRASLARSTQLSMARAASKRRSLKSKARKAKLARIIEKRSDPGQESSNTDLCPCTKDLLKQQLLHPDSAESSTGTDESLLGEALEQKSRKKFRQSADPLASQSISSTTLTELEELSDSSQEALKNLQNKSTKTRHSKTTSTIFNPLVDKLGELDVGGELERLGDSTTAGLKTLGKLGGLNFNSKSETSRRKSPILPQLNIPNFMGGLDSITGQSSSHSSQDLPEDQESGSRLSPESTSFDDSTEHSSAHEPGLQQSHDEVEGSKVEHEHPSAQTVISSSQLSIPELEKSPSSESSDLSTVVSNVVTKAQPVIGGVGDIISESSKSSHERSESQPVTSDQLGENQSSSNEVVTHAQSNPSPASVSESSEVISESTKSSHESSSESQPVNQDQPSSASVQSSETSEVTEARSGSSEPASESPASVTASTDQTNHGESTETSHEEPSSGQTEVSSAPIKPLTSDQSSSSQSSISEVVTQTQSSPVPIQSLQSSEITEARSSSSELVPDSPVSANIEPTTHNEQAATIHDSPSDKTMVSSSQLSIPELEKSPSSESSDLSTVVSNVVTKAQPVIGGVGDIISESSKSSHERSESQPVTSDQLGENQSSSNEVVTHAQSNPSPASVSESSEVTEARSGSSEPVSDIPTSVNSVIEQTNRGESTETSHPEPSSGQTEVSSTPIKPWTSDQSSGSQSTISEVVTQTQSSPTPVQSSESSEVTEARSSSSESPPSNSEQSSHEDLTGQHDPSSSKSVVSSSQLSIPELEKSPQSDNSDLSTVVSHVATKVQPVIGGVGDLISESSKSSHERSESQSKKVRRPGKHVTTTTEVLSSDDLYESPKVNALPKRCRNKLRSLRILIDEILMLVERIAHGNLLDESVSYHSRDLLSRRLAKIRHSAREARMATYLANLSIVTETVRAAGIDLIKLSNNKLARKLEPNLRAIAMNLRKEYGLYRKVCKSAT